MGGETGGETGGAAARLLRAAGDRRGRRPLAWAAAPLRGAERVLELGIGAGLLAAELPAGRWIGVDARAAGATTADAGSGARVRAVPTALPLATNAVDAVCLLLVLPRLLALDAVFAEIRRVLRPAGMLVTVVPSASVRTLAELQLARLLRPVRHGAWPNRSGLDGAGWLLAAADFAVMGDDRVPFTVPLPDAAAAINTVADLAETGLWPPDLPTNQQTRIADQLTGRTGPGRVLPVPMRRLVARR